MLLRQMEEGGDDGTHRENLAKPLEDVLEPANGRARVQGGGGREGEGEDLERATGELTPSLPLCPTWRPHVQRQLAFSSRSFAATPCGLCEQCRSMPARYSRRSDLGGNGCDRQVQYGVCDHVCVCFGVGGCLESGQCLTWSSSYSG